jgi:hypothetical protein
VTVKAVTESGKGNKKMKSLLLLTWMIPIAGYAVVTNHFVRPPGTGATPLAPYTNWDQAATNIQLAIDASAASDVVIVSNGVYDTGGATNNYTGNILTNRVSLNKAITVRSANNDPANTIIVGAWDPVKTNGAASVRCVSMVANSFLIGFTLTNGSTLTSTESAQAEDRKGGGVYCPSTSPIISNCVIAGNSASVQAGGANYGTLYNCILAVNSVWSNSASDTKGGGACGSTMYNCTLTGNSARVASLAYGGGIYGGTLYNSTLINNSANYGAGSYNTILSNCTVVGNYSGNQGGGAMGGTLYNCMITNNSADGYGGGINGGIVYNSIITRNWTETDSYSGGGGAAYATLYNCLLAGNNADWQGGGADGSTLYNCTVTRNTSRNSYGGVRNCVLYNCIVYFNDASNWASSAMSFTNCCTYPAQAGWAVGNITNDPQFVSSGSGYGTNFVAGNYRLANNSPCIDAGTNQNWMTNIVVDLDGFHRIDVFRRQVDIGCYEYLPSGFYFGGR